jgi:hypothetical protein
MPGIIATLSPYDEVAASLVLDFAQRLLNLYSMTHTAFVLLLSSFISLFIIT